MSDGSTNSHAASAAAVSTRAAMSAVPSSIFERPTSAPPAASSGKHMAPPTRSASATVSIFSMTPILSDTLAPPSSTTKGRAGSASSRPRISSSRAMSRPATPGSTSGTPTVEACARWAVPKASFT